MPIQKETKLNTGAIMPLVGLGTLILHWHAHLGAIVLIPLDLPRDMEVEPRGGRARSRVCT